MKDEPTIADPELTRSDKTLRDEFAGKAIQGFCANPSVFRMNECVGFALHNCTLDELAELAIATADAMLVARGS